MWAENIRRSREVIEVKYGVTPKFLIVRQEIWSLLCEELMEPNTFDMDGMIIAVTDNLLEPFEFGALPGDMPSNEQEN